jgi:hypothetical protein
VTTPLTATRLRRALLALTGTAALLAPAPATATQLAPAYAAPERPPEQPATDWPARLQGATRAALAALADSARAAGLPVRPLYDKAAEGVLKRADDARIVGAVRALARDLGSARAVLGAAASPAELVAGVAAMRAGVQRDALAQLAAARSARASSAGTASLAVTLTLVADLVGRGVPADDAARSVGALVARGLADAELSALWEGIRSDIAAGVAPRAAALERTRAVVEGLEGPNRPRGRPVPRVVPPGAAPDR